MRLTDRDNEMFNQLAGSEIGEWLQDYLTRLSDELADVRVIKEVEGDISKETALAGYLAQKQLRNVINQLNRSQREQKTDNEYE